MLKFAVHAEEEGSVSGEEDGELSDGNGSDVAIFFLYIFSLKSKLLP